MFIYLPVSQNNKKPNDSGSSSNRKDINGIPLYQYLYPIGFNQIDTDRQRERESYASKQKTKSKNYIGKKIN